MNYLISGVPCCLKTQFGNWLQERGWLHIDMEAWQNTPQWQLWEKYYQSDMPEFFRLLNKAAPNIVFTWGYPPQFHQFVRKFQECGVVLWWFDGDHAAARAGYIGRATGRITDFDAQMVNIQSFQAQLDALYGANKIRTLDAQGNYLAFEDIAKVVGLPLQD